MENASVESATGRRRFCLIRPGEKRPNRRARIGAGAFLGAAAAAGFTPTPAPAQPAPEAQGAPPAELREAADALRAGESERAEAAFRAFLGGREEDPAALQQAGALWLLAGEPARAIPLLRASVAADPGLADARLALGQALGQTGDDEGALAQLAEARKIAPSRYEAPYLAAAVLDRAGRLPEAVEEARAAAALAPRNPQVRRFLGRFLLRIEAWPEAAAELEAALRHGFREDPAIFGELGAALLGQERLDAAEAAYERRRAFAPDDAETHLQLGYIAWRRGEDERSEELLRRAIALDPGLLRAHHFLGLTALRRDDLDGAEAAFRLALERDGGFAEAWFHLGKIALRRGNPEEAERLLGEAVERAPDYAEAYYQLAFARRRLGDREGADRSLARFEELRRREAPARPEDEPRQQPDPVRRRDP